MSVRTIVTLIDLRLLCLPGCQQSCCLLGTASKSSSPWWRDFAEYPEPRGDREDPAGLDPDPVMILPDIMVVD